MGRILIQPTLGGIVKNTGFQNRPPYTAYDLLNIWPIDPFTGRAIMASRPPLSTLSSPSGFNTMLANVNGVAPSESEQSQSFLGAFGGSLHWWNGAGFTAATGGQTVPTDRPTFAATLFDKVYVPKAASKPIVFNYTTGDAAVIVETAGTAPDDTFIIVEWLGALWVVDNDEPHVLVASRVGAPTDWDVAAPIDDRYGAYSSTVTSPGAIGAPINAIIPQTSDVALISTLKGIFALRGHPRQGGVFDNISPTYILGQGAWCKGPDDTVYFLTPKGMMSLPPGAYTIPTLVSKDKIPEELIGLAYEYDNPVVSMAYDSRWDGVQIAVRGAQEQSWLYHVPTGGFFRQEFTGYPYVIMEHEPFVTDQSSGLLFGGVNVKFFDKFATEDFETAGTIGPVKTTESSHEKARIIRLKAIFGGDTPTGEGTFAVAVGTDGQDAINRALLGNHQYTHDMTKLAANDGVCFPSVSGHAMVIDFSIDSGRIAFEGIESLTAEAGVNRLPRGEQIAPDGEPIDFTETTDDFDSDNWIGYVEATPAVPPSTLPDFSLWVDLSRLPACWWDEVNSNGSDIRVTDNNNVEVPFDLVNFDAVAQTGFLVLKMTQANPPTPVRIWRGNPFVGAYDPTDTFGQYNAYDANWIAFYPGGGQDENDRTVNQNNLTLVGTDDTALVDGTIGVQATDYTTLDATNNYGRATAVVPSTTPVTLVVVAKDEDTTAVASLGVRSNTGDTQENLELTNQRGASTQRAEANTTDSAGLSNEAVSTALSNSSTFRHFAGVFASSTSRTAYIDGGNSGSNTTERIVDDLDEIIIGKGSRSGLSSSSVTADLCLAQVHNVVRSGDWIDYQEQMLNQTTFWGAWGSCVQVNDPDDIDPPDAPPADTVTCPSGFVTPVETGTWSGYAEATPIAPSTNQSNWVHWIDLSDMPTEWWAAVAADGHDIRATDEANIFLPIDLIEFDSVGETGFACVRQNQSATTPAAIRLWVGNATAITLTVCANYGQYRVYDENWVGFWPDGGGNDRTSYRNHFTMTGSPTVGGVTGPIGNFGTNYDGSTQYGTQLVSPVINSYPATFAAVTRVDAFTQTGAVISASRTSYLSHDTLIHTPYTNPTRFRARANGNTHDAVSETVESINTWTHKAGFAANNVTRNVVVAGGTLYSSPKKSLPLRPFGRLSIAARVTGSGEVYWPFDGDICLASAHNTLRAQDNSWAEYQAAMLDQNTFWNLGGGTWIWTADSNSLPQ